ncbi:MAG: thiamine pyrophosphate-dependent dehydrogenase E1 component subunit alpha [Actinobacteria bacterium]|nr:thiamine pyrophosphate-dependent dehydrogenase E1 component subunit alpha [Actinomycetota bacterium]
MSKILKKIGAQKALEMYKRMLKIRRFEERVRYLFLEGIMPGTIHQYDGQEACAVGVCSALADGDVIASTHRPHGHAIAKGLTCKEIMAELFGKTTGCCKGKGGSMHLGNMDKGMLPSIAIVGGNLPIVTGMGLAFKLRSKKNVAVSFFGDGASNEGAFHEAINLAAIYDIPAVFVCENNLYGASTHVSIVCKLKNIADRACAYGIDGVVADGNDVLAVYETAEKVIKKARNGGGPSILELKTFRRCGHSRRDSKAYMRKEELDYWMARDPIAMFKDILLKAGFCSEEDLERISKEVDAEVEEAVEYAQASPDPRPEDALEDIFA